MADKPLQPTSEMIDAGISQLWEVLPGVMDDLYQQVEDEDERQELLSDTVSALWRAMYLNAPKEDKAA